MEKGYRVRGTVRSLRDEKKVAPLRGLVKNPKHPLELVEADLLNESSWLSAVKDCTFVLHTASPFPISQPSDEMEVNKTRWLIYIKSTSSSLFGFQSFYLKLILFLDLITFIGWSKSIFLCFSIT